MNTAETKSEKRIKEAPTPRRVVGSAKTTGGTKIGGLGQSVGNSLKAQIQKTNLTEKANADFKKKFLQLRTGPLVYNL